MDGTIIQQGSFVSDGVGQVLQLRSDVDWVRLHNYTQMGLNPNPGVAVGGYWQRGMAQGTGIAYVKTAAANTIEGRLWAAPYGFYYLDTSTPQFGPLSACTAVSNATPPRVTSTPATTGMWNGMTVRMYDVAGAHQLGGIDFTVNVIGGNTFDLIYAPTIVAGTNGTYRWNPVPQIFFPPKRVITAITLGSPTVIRMAVTHNLVVGQKVRISMPDALLGTVELDGISANVVAINTTTNTISIDVDSTAFTAFQFPLTAYPPISLPLVIPFGEGPNVPNALDDALYNVSYLGMGLVGGAQNPGGAAADVIYWTAGKSFNV